MKNTIKLILISAIVAIATLSCTGLWKVQNSVDIQFTLSKEALLDARVDSMLRSIDGDDLDINDDDENEGIVSRDEATISLHYASNNRLIAANQVFLVDNNDVVVTFNNLEIIGQSVYAKIEAELDGVTYVGTSDTKKMLAELNDLRIVGMSPVDEVLLNQENMPTVYYNDRLLKNSDVLDFSKGLRFESETKGVVFKYQFSEESSFTELPLGVHTVSEIPRGSKTVAVKTALTGYRDSDTVTIYFEQLESPTPIINPVSGQKPSGELAVTINADFIEGIKVYYTLGSNSFNEANPTENNWLEYVAPFTVDIKDAEIQVRSVALVPGYKVSEEVSEKYVPQGKLMSPSFNPPSNTTATEGQVLYLVAEFGTDIYFTSGNDSFDAEQPTSNGWTKYTSGSTTIDFTNSTEVDGRTVVTYKAIAVKSGLIDSDISEATYIQAQITGLDIKYDGDSLVNGSAIDLSNGFEFDCEISGVDYTYAFFNSAGDSIKSGSGDEILGSSIPNGAVKLSVTASKTGFKSESKEVSFKQSHYYVSETNSDNTNAATSQKPLQTVQEAVDRIITSDDGEDDDTDYVIVVRGTVFGGSDDTESDVVIANVNELNITIQGFSNSEKGTINPQDAKRVLYVNGANLNITLADNISISGADISNNGGGLYVAAGNISLKGNAQISNNRAALGGGVYVDSGRLTMLKGEIRENYATAIGGGAYINSNATFTMEDGEITLNQAEVNAGGIFISGTTSEIASGRITLNTAGIMGNGGGLYIENGASLGLRGEPTISGNVRGGAISNGTLDSSSATINNLAYAYTDDNNRGKITVSNLTGGRIGITPHDRAGPGAIIIPSPVSENVKNVVFCDTSDSYTVKNGALVIAVSSIYYVSIVGNDAFSGLNSTDAFASVQKAIEIILSANASSSAGFDEYIINVTGTIMDEGSIASGDDDGMVEIESSSATPINITIQGWDDPTTTSVVESGTIQATDKRVVNINGANLSVTLGANLTLTGGSADNGAGVRVMNGAQLSVAGATISGNTASGYGGAIYAHGTGTEVSMTSGLLQSNNANYGGGVYVADGSHFSFGGGTIELNTATTHGGGISTDVDNGVSSVTMTGGSILANTSTNNNAGGVLVSFVDTFTMTGGTISNNKGGPSTTHNGGGVYVENTGTFNISGNPTITGNGSGGDITNGTWSGGKVSNVFIQANSTSESPVKLVGSLTGGRIGVSPANIEPGYFVIQGLSYTIENEDLEKIYYDTTNRNDYFVRDATDNTVEAPPTTFYVSSTGSESNSGITTNQAFLTVQSAVDKIQKINDQSSTYTIIVSGAIYGTGTNAVDISSSETLHITIQGLSSSSHGYIDGQNARRVLNVSGANVVVTLGSNLTIQNGSTDYGAGVRVVNGAQLSVAGATIKENTATAYGGAIYAHGTGTEVSMTLGLLQSNNANYGGGVYVADGSHFSFGGGTIELNTATIHGGGVSTDAESGVSSVTMTGGNILANTSTDYNAGGVLVSFLDTFTMTGGTISNNKGGPTTSHNGGGLYVEANAFFNISGNPTITNNGSGGNIANGVWSGGKVSNVFIQDNSTSASPVKLVGSLTGGRIGVSPANIEPGYFVIQGLSYTIKNEDLEKIYYDATNRNDYFVLDTSGDTSIEAPPTTFYVRSNGRVSDSGISTEQAFLTVQGAVDKILAINDQSSTYTIIVSGTTFGTGTNAVDISSSETLNITIQGSSSSSLGYIDGEDTRRVLNVEGANVLVTLGSNLGIQNGRAADGAGVQVLGGAEVILNGATIGSTNAALGNYATQDGGGVAVAGTGAVFRLSSGNIYNNSANAGGGLVVGTGATAYMTGGTIGGSLLNSNEARLVLWGGGGVYINNSTFTMSGGTISYNTTLQDTDTYGGGIFAMNNATVNVSGTAKIQHNTAGLDGGGVYIKGDSDFELNGANAIISNNTAKWGGGLYVQDSGSVATIKNGVISHNIAEGKVGYITSGAGVFINGSGRVVMSGGSVVNNTQTSGDGAGVLIDDATLELSGNAIIKDNTSGNTLSNVYKRHSSGKIYVSSSFNDEANIGIMPSSGTLIGTSIAIGSNYSISKNDMYAFVNDQNNNEGFKALNGNLVLSNTYDIGDVGPGGGLIYSKNGNTYWEVSDDIGYNNWYDAYSISASYNGGGNIGWHLPSLADLTDVYNALRKPGLPLQDVTFWYWATDKSVSGKVEVADVKTFHDGRSTTDFLDKVHNVRAIRTFTTP